MKKLTVDAVAQSLRSLGYVEQGGSNVFRLLADPRDGQYIKIYYVDYDIQEDIVIHESVEAHVAHDI